MMNIDKKPVSFWFISLSMMILLSTTSYSLGIGVSPGVIDLGDVPRGKEVAVSFYIISNTREPLPVTLSYVPVHRDVLFKEKSDPYVMIPAEVSEEDISSWIEFPQNPYILDPNNVKVITLPDGTSIKYNRKATFILKVPKDAEPGYHAGAINIIPKLRVETSGGAGVATVGITRLICVFRVPCVAERKGTIIDFEAEREAKNRVRIDVLFKNTGTTTITARLSELQIKDNEGNVIDLLAGSATRIAPGDTVVLHGFWTSSEEIPSEKVRVEAKVDYITGQVTKEDVIKIPAEIVAKVQERASPKRKIPWWFLMIILALIGLYVYWKM